MDFTLILTHPEKSWFVLKFPLEVRFTEMGSAGEEVCILLPILHKALLLWVMPAFPLLEKRDFHSIKIQPEQV